MGPTLTLTFLIRGRTRLVIVREVGIGHLDPTARRREGLDRERRKRGWHLHRLRPALTPTGDGQTLPVIGARAYRRPQSRGVHREVDP
jgi:hypothetical protein